MSTPKHATGFTLIELMISVAIIALLAGIAIPAYNNYVRESQFSAARMNAEPLRLALEDYWLDNGSYEDFKNKVWKPGGTKTLEDDLGWRPDGDNDQYNYEMTVATTNTFTIKVTNIGSNRSVSCPKQAACTYAD